MEKTITLTKKELIEIGERVLEEMNKDYESINTNDENFDRMSNMMFLLQNTLVVNKLVNTLFEDKKEPTE